MLVVYSALTYHALSYIRIVVGRVFLNNTTGEAYKQCFTAMFEKVKEGHENFKVGVTLKGIIVDWSDAQLAGLKDVVIDEVASSGTKSCQVTSTVCLSILANVFSAKSKACLTWTDYRYFFEAVYKASKPQRKSHE